MLVNYEYALRMLGSTVVAHVYLPVESYRVDVYVDGLFEDGSGSE